MEGKEEVKKGVVPGRREREGERGKSDLCFLSQAMT